jgi:perosamine synthetase
LSIKNSDRILEAVKAALREPKKFLPLHEPSIGDLEKQFVNDCIESTFVSSVGKYVDRFEIEIAKYTGVKRAVAVVNGTAALHISLLLAGVKQNDEVLAPGLTFVATANAVSYCGAIPHFVDAEEDTLGIDPSKLDNYLASISEFSGEFCINKNTGRKISAIVPVHIFGHPCKIDAILEVARKYNLEVVEDAAESLGSFYKGKHTGTFGKLGAISFNGNKIITTGGGGMIITDDEELACQAKHITTTAKVAHKWEYVHDRVGYNYRMPNLNAALGCAQLSRLQDFLNFKRKLYESYRKQFTALGGIRLVSEPSDCSSNYWLQTILLDNTNIDLRDSVLACLNDMGLMSRPAWVGLHKLKPFQDCPRMDMSTTDCLEKRIINIPSSLYKL